MCGSRPSREEAKAAIARDWMAGRKDGEDAIVLAHTRADVRDLNEAIRRARAETGELSEAAAFQAGQGKREFAAGDRIVFLKNDRELGVKNGTLGTVEAAEADRLTVVLDGGKASRERITVEAHAYAAVDHGYAVTIHKSQGATVDRAFVLASGGMDRHLTYVAMTRHREQAALYAGRDDFENYKAMAGRLARKRTKETTLDFAERRGIDTLRDWIGNGRALLNRAQARFEQAAARIGERLGLGGRSLRQELQERRQQTAEPAAMKTPAGIETAPAQPQRAADEGLPLEARWKAAIAAEFKAVQDKAQRTMALAGKRKAAIAKKLHEIERAEPAKPGWFSLPSAKDRYKEELAEWTKERDSLVAALNRTRQRGAKAMRIHRGGCRRLSQPGRAAGGAEGGAAISRACQGDPGRAGAAKAGTGGGDPPEARTAARTQPRTGRAGTLSKIPPLRCVLLDPIAGESRGQRR